MVAIINSTALGLQRVGQAQVGALSAGEAAGGSSLPAVSRVESFTRALQDAMNSMVSPGENASEISATVATRARMVGATDRAGHPSSGDRQGQTVASIDQDIVDRPLYDAFAAGGNARAATGVSLGGGAAGVVEGPGSGTDFVREGLSQARGVTDARIAAVKARAEGAMEGADALIAAQYELVRFSLFMDVTSKLVGKATQTVDTLMKGS